MDKNYYFQKRAQEFQREISKELANRHLIEGAQRGTLTAKQAGRLVMRLAPVVIVITILLLLSLLG